MNEETMTMTPEMDSVDTTPSQWYKAVSLEDAKAFIKTNLASAARSFIAIGYYLKRVRDDVLYLEDSHDSVWSFAQAEYGISKSTASRYMSMNDRFSVDGNSPVIQEEYRSFDKSKLQEMLYLTDEQIGQITPDNTVQEIRGLRVPKEIPYFELEGQMEFESDFPEILPDTDTQPFPEAVYPLAQQSQDFVLDVSELLQEQEETIATSQQLETYQVEAHNKTEEEPEEAPENEKHAEIVDGESTEIHETEPENLTDLQLAKEELDRANNLLKTCLSTGIGEDDIHIRAMKIKVCAMASYVCDLDMIENPPEKSEQPELPILKNNDQRAAFIDAYENWPLWTATEQTGERYYRYDLPDGTSLVVKVYHAKLFDHSIDAKRWEDRYREGWGRHEYYLLQEGKFFRDCDTNRSALVEKLKEIQKKEK